MQDRGHTKRDNVRDVSKYTEADLTDTGPSQAVSWKGQRVTAFDQGPSPRSVYCSVGRQLVLTLFRAERGVPSYAGPSLADQAHSPGWTLFFQLKAFQLGLQSCGKRNVREPPQGGCNRTVKCLDVLHSV